MRKIILSFAIVAISAIAFTLTSCSTELGVNTDESAVVNAVARAIEAPSVDYCGKTKVVKLLAGQDIDVGTVTVGNDAENLYVTYKVTGDWKMKGLHLFVGDCNKLPTNEAGNLTPGQFPYKKSYTEYLTEYTFVIPLQDIPDVYCVAAHAEVVRVIDGEEIGKGETAFGDGDKVGSNWFMKFGYEKQPCEEEEPPTDCYQTETGWANGPRYVKQGNWAMYTPVFTDDVLWAPLNSPVNIYAGNPKNNPVIAGTVTLAWNETEEGKIDITITLQDGWELQDVKESVKINGYDPAPSGNPNPGSFKYKGTSLTWTVDLCRYLGIHLDLRKKIDCPPTE